jgi:hypothetical protein
MGCDRSGDAAKRVHAEILKLASEEKLSGSRLAGFRSPTKVEAEHHSAGADDSGAPIQVTTQRGFTDYQGRTHGKDR